MAVQPHRAPGRPPAEKDQEKRDRLLDCAFQLFASQGVAATTRAAVARAAGVTPAMTHYYFSGQDGLVDAFLEERLLPVFTAIWDGLPQPEATPETLLTALIDRLLDAVTENPLLPQLWSREILCRNSMLRQKLLDRLPTEKVRAAAAVFAAAQQDGTLRRDIIPQMIFPAVVGLVMLPLAARDLFTTVTEHTFPEKERLRRHALALLLHGITRNGDAQ